ncbi:MotA/TolQ/ExbB proton channel family protein [Coraliomargarita sp. W4R53]
MSTPTNQNILYNWSRQDLEQRFRFSGGKFTDTNASFTFLLALAMTALTFLALNLVAGAVIGQGLVAKFTERGYIPVIITFFFYWTVAILIVKRSKVAFQRSLLTVAVIPAERGFTLNPETAPACLHKIERLVDSPERFILLHRIEVALSNLSNIGNISDVSAILAAQSQKDEQMVASSFNLVSGFIWAIPVFGFIGTVIGLADAIQGFGSTLQLATDLESIKSSMTLVVQGLSTAFDTTFLALVAAVVLQILLSFQKRKEIRFLDECDSYCQQQILNKLRLVNNVA